MKDVAYLLATLDQLQHTRNIINISSTEIKGDLYIKYQTVNNKKASRFNSFSVASFSKRINFDWSELRSRVTSYLTITNQNIVLDDDISYYCYLAFKHYTEDSIQYAEIESNKLKYRKSGITNTCNIGIKPDIVLGAECILDGLQIVEYAGSHYTVVTAAKKEHLTTSSSCSCLEFTQLHRCNHTKLISLVTTQRRVLIQNKVLKVCY